MKNIIAAVAVIMTLSAGANAIDWKKPEVGVGLYDAMPQSGQYKDGVKSGMGLNLSADWNVNDQIMAGVELGYSFGQDFKNKILGKQYTMDSTMIGLRGKYVKPMDFGSKKGNVYGIVGIGYYMVSYDPSASFLDDDNKLGLSLGAGANVELNANWTAGLELRVHMVEAATDLNPMLKAGYKF